VGTAALSGRDESLFLAEWSGPDGCELDDWRAIAQANPALGHTVSPQAIKSALGTDPPNMYRTEVLCQGVDQLDGAVDLASWRACADPTGSLGVRNRVVLCLDTSPALDHVTLAAAVLDDGRVRTEIVRGLGVHRGRAQHCRAGSSGSSRGRPDGSRLGQPRHCSLISRPGPACRN
jgi:hypothetical protein